MKDHNYVVWTDGSTKTNPGPGGLGVVICLGDNNIEISKGYDLTTNNRMELLAIITALEEVGPGKKVEVKTDSQYSIDCMTKYIWGWKRKGWVTGQGTRVKNKDLIIRLDELIRVNQVKFTKVKAHVGILLNERADQLAKDGSNAEDKEVDEGYLEELALPKETPNKHFKPWYKHKR